jgi:hypothetical protein
MLSLSPNCSTKDADVDEQQL